MKIYVIKGTEGEAGYLKQSMKLPKSWGTKPVAEVLGLFVDTYNKKHPDAAIDAGGWHLERPLGSTLYPDDQVSSTLSDYCDVWCVAGSVKYKGPPPGTAAALEAKEAEERKAREEEAARAEAARDAAEANGPDAAQWHVKVRCIELDRGGMDVKSQWKVGDVAKVTIEPHATIGMLANRLGLMVGAHPKHQHIYHPRDGGAAGAQPLSPLEKLKDAMASDLVVLELVIKVPTVARVVEDVSDDEGFTGPEAGDLPPAFPEECADLDKQADLKTQAEEKLAAGDVDAALGFFSDAIALGAPSATMLCKRGDLLLKRGRPAAAAADATKALEINQDSAKAYRLRAKARRKLGQYDDSSADFGQAQRIDFDDGVVEEQTYVAKRAKKLRAKLLAEQEKENAADANHA
ncbi:hypothetical protein CTAYLR_004402 [Chrysophaeum taylorii]|uniref:Uncharacterized protein n=1 Tax=Chrysophaeum taylorii TaxID=2483200 RepID=A0AAD7XQV6_9STRA|nr:hypothetical protein CTAYLR_004402 [Chrysophaeum taylorii]